MTNKIAPEPTARPRPREIQEALGFVPLLAAFFRRAHTDMPVELREAFSSHRLTARHGAVLTQLLAQDSIGVTDLARRMGLSLSTASELVGDLNRAGWVTRREDPADHRRTLVALPMERRPVVEDFVAVRAAPLLRAMDALSADERHGFVAGLQAWAHEVRNW
ncbi:MarR family winged helix-turn-helix transcriptional regulator [Streptantibioticus ferralitis]|uniref:MarR family transcriptional regulator n=1 Tax=Streptantibioticus ferralitis TaxID=236510 RepID=A0ABT5Z3U4_9ACTN|nr:MarR family transcriptional regulator [Streptantibioticus ferralitis]MDF2258505.1 MarR family transcriptional regulator [Streptantibioticus ferralitis]